MKPYCPCTDCQQRTVERLRTADDSALRHMIAALKAYLADYDERGPAPKEEKP